MGDLGGSLLAWDMEEVDVRLPLLVVLLLLLCAGKEVSGET
jgi:hypothetical protein